MERIDFKKTFVFEGEEFKGIDLDLDKLTGDDVTRAERECAALGRPTGAFAEGNKTYLAVLAAYAANKPVDFMMKLPISEFTKVTVTVQNFLLS